jgi:hypothetical protein
MKIDENKESEEMTTGNERVSWTYFTLHEIYGA